jgi:hypothetical protein
MEMRSEYTIVRLASERIRVESIEDLSVKESYGSPIKIRLAK